MIQEFENQIVNEIIQKAAIILRTRGPHEVYDFWNTLTPGQQSACDISIVSTGDPAIFVSKKPEVRFVEWLRAVCYS